MKGPVRTCVACRRCREQSRLVRTVLQNSGDLWIDLGTRGRVRRPAGRGAYVCPGSACIDRALGTGALGRALKYPGTLPDRLRDELMRAAAIWKQ